jgi:hypothetical protein
MSKQDTQTAPVRPTAGKTKRQLRENVRKWTKAVWSLGWTGVPNVLLTRQHELGLDPTDLNILMQLASYWWMAKNPPRPSKGTIAKRMGLKDPASVRRRIRALEERGFLKRVERTRQAHNGKAENFYDLRPLVGKLLKLAQRVRKEKAEKRKAARV